MARQHRHGYPPWSVAGGADLGISDSERFIHCRALTAVNLVGAYQRRFPDDERPEYERVIRRMGHVWDCPRDGTANVVGYRCARCRRAQPGRLVRAQSVAYIRRLCTAFSTRGVDAVVPLVPDDVEWMPQLAGGRVLRGSDELRHFLGPHRAEVPTPRATRLEPVGDHVLVRFEPVLPEADAIWSTYLFDEGRLVRAVSFPDEADAVRASL